MAGLLIESGALELAQNVLAQTNAVELQIHLYVNNYTPLWTSSLSNFTECTATGYFAQQIDPTYWTFSGGSTPPVVATAVPVLWTFTAGLSNVLYGYYLININTGVLYFAEKFTSSYAIPSGGGSYVVVPNINWSPT